MCVITGRHRYSGSKYPNRLSFAGGLPLVRRKNIQVRLVGPLGAGRPPGSDTQGAATQDRIAYPCQLVPRQAATLQSYNVWRACLFRMPQLVYPVAERQQAHALPANSRVLGEIRRKGSDPIPSAPTERIQIPITP